MASESTSSGNSQQGAGSTPEQIMANYSQYLPQYLQMNTDQIPAFSNAISNAGLSSVQGAGGQTASSVSNLTNQLNPAIGTANAAASGALNSANTAGTAASKGLDAITLNGLSPGEYNATERALNKTNIGTGNNGLINPTNTISNAMNFGGAFNSKIPLYNSAVNTAMQAPTAFGTASSAASGAANASTNANAGVNAIANPAALATTSSLANVGLLNQVAQGNYSFGNSKNDSQSVGVSSGCCFIFLEAYHGTLPPSIRKYRDHYYRKCPTMANGYTKMAKWLVPLMQRSAVVNDLVWKYMVLPATLHSIHPVNNWNKRVSHFWLKLWTIYGKI